MRPKSTLSNLWDTTSIHFTFIWEDPLPQGCLAHDHTQRVWYQKYLVNQSREGFPVTMDEKKRIVFKIKLVAEPLKVRTQPRSLYLDNPLSLVALGTGSVLFRTALWYCFGAWILIQSPAQPCYSDSIPTQPYSAMQLIKTTTQSQSAILKWTVPNPSRRM